MKIPKKDIIYRDKDFNILCECCEINDREITVKYLYSQSVEKIKTDQFWLIFEEYEKKLDY
jgi:hypothetical protein